MSGAAPAPWRAAFRLAAVLVTVLAAGSATARCAASQVTDAQPPLPETLRGAQIGPADLLKSGAASALAEHGVNVVLVGRSTVSQGDLRKVDALAKRLGLRPFMYSTGRAGAASTCGPKQAAVIWHCAQIVPSVRAAARLAQRGGLAIVKTSTVTLLRMQHQGGPGRVIFLVRAPRAAASVAQLRKVILARKLDVIVSRATPTLSPPSSGSVFSPPAAQLWVDVDGGSCTRSAAPVGYSDAGACASINAAYLAAQCGDTVLIRAGTYGNGVLNSDPSKVSCSSDVVISAAPGEAVSWGTGAPHTGNCAVNTSNLDVCGSHVNLKDITLNCTCLFHEGSNNDTLTNVTTKYSLYVRGSQNFKMIGGHVGPFNSNGGAGDGIVIGCETCTTGVVADDSPGKLRPSVTLDGVTFSHILKTVDMAAHTDCFQATTFASLTIINSTFTACADAPIILGDENQAVSQSSNLLIQNNFVNEGTSQGLTIAARYRGSLVVQYNTFNTGAFNVQSPVVFRGNAFTMLASGTCNALTSAGAALTYNVFGSGSAQCGPTNFVSRRAFGFKNSAGTPPNLHIGPTSPLIGRGDPANHPASDIDGQPRPSVRRPDAGADQLR
jgi:hypothetical protein